MKELVTGHPYTTETVLSKDDEFILLACDGVSTSFLSPAFESHTNISLALGRLLRPRSRRPRPRHRRPPRSLQTTRRPRPRAFLLRQPQLHDCAARPQQEQTARSHRSREDTRQTRGRELQDGRGDDGEGFRGSCAGEGETATGC